MMTGRLIRIFIIVWLSAVAAPGSAVAGGEFDISGVTRLIDVLDAIMARHADFDSVSAVIKTSSPEQRAAILDRKRQENVKDGEINRRIDALLKTTAYRIYYEQFTNMTPQQHREMLLALPYQALPGPADISVNLRDLCFHRGEVRAWTAGVVAAIDAESCRRIASEWLPAGDHPIPKTYFIYDGNGDAFARGENVVFDLFSLVVARHPAATRFSGLETIGTDEIERVLSHEYHHIFAEPLLYPPGRSFSSWQQRRKDAVVRSIVSEGIAMRCDGRRALQRAVMEDTATVTFWIDQLETTFQALDDSSMSEETFQKWYRDSFHETAAERLRIYLERVHANAGGDAESPPDPTSRPSLVYTLGWWIIGRIAEAPAGREAVIGLLTSPGGVFERYNATLPGTAEALRIDVTLP